MLMTKPGVTAMLFVLTLLLAGCCSRGGCLQGQGGGDRASIEQEHIAKLRSMTDVPEVPDDFYEYLGFRDWYRFPLVYPYAVYSVDGTDVADLADDSKVADFSMAETQYLDVGGITELGFDENLLLVYNGSYLIFDMATRETETFETKQEMLHRAQERGFEAEVEMMSMSEYARIFGY